MLADLIQKYAVIHEERKLKSGVISPYYIDMRKLSVSSYNDVICDYLHQIVAEAVDGGMVYDAIGGPSSGADPIIGAALALPSCLKFIPEKATPGKLVRARGFCVRKAAKDHGDQSLVYGSIQRGDRCIVIEDTVTSGGSLMHAVDAVEKELDCKVVLAITVVDRLAGATELFAKRRIPFKSILTIKDLGL